MHKEDSRAAMKEKPTTIMKGESVVDAYYENAFQVFFDSNDRVELIELWKSDSLVVLYKGVDVFRTEAENIRDVIGRDAPFASDAEGDGYSFTFPRLELCLWRGTNDKLDPNAQYFESIGIGKFGYFTNSSQ